MSYYLHAFCLDESKYGAVGELLLGPFEWVGMTWGYVRGMAAEPVPPPSDHQLTAGDDGALHLVHHQPHDSGGWEMVPRSDSFYSDLEILTEVDLRHFAGDASLYADASEVPLRDCHACGHPLIRHEGYPASTSDADWHASLPDTPCEDCSCTWAEDDGWKRPHRDDDATATLLAALNEDPTDD